jgi:hypothetical protein
MKKNSNISVKRPMKITVSSSGKKKQETIKVTLPPPPPQKKKGNLQPKLKESKKTLLADFVTALVRPFSPEVQGCRVPDPWSFPTVPYHLHSTSVVSTAVYTAGSIMFLPNPLLSLIDLTSLRLNTGSQIVSPGNSGLVQLNASSTTVGYSLYGASTPANLASVASTYRVVTWGIKISNLTPELAATGRLIFTYIPLTNTVPNIDALTSGVNTNVTTNSSINLLNALTGSPLLDTSEILSLPTSFEIAVQDLLHGDLELAGKYTAPGFFEFRNTQAYGIVNSTYNEADDIVFAPATGLVSTALSGYKDPTSMHGSCAIVMRMEGMPPATNVLQIEMIYHLECQPQLALTNSQAIPVVSSPESIMPVGTTNIIEASMIATKDENKIVSWIRNGTDFLNRNRDDIVGGISSVAKFVGAAMAFL